MFMKLRDVGLFVRSARTDWAISRMRPGLGQQAIFDAVYRSGDPWASNDARFRYQTRKYDVLDALLGKRRFGRALDIGAGLGGLARRLADRADQVLGLDVSEQAVIRAKMIHASAPNLSFAQGDVLDLPAALDGTFDLVAVTDTLYYLPPPIEDGLLKMVAERLTRLLRPGGTLLIANHYFFAADPDSRLSRRIHLAFTWSPGLRLVSAHRRPFYLAALLEAVEPVSLRQFTAVPAAELA